MTHFLARLVERARGTAARVEPIIAPRFAPDPATEIATEVEAPSLTRPGSAAILETASPSPRVAKTESLPLLSRAQRDDQPAPPQEPEPEPLEARPEIGRESLLVPLPANSPDLAHSALVREVKAVHDEVSAPKRSSGQLPGPQRQPRPPRLAKSGSPPFVTKTLQNWVDDQPAEPPVVRVTIGRIEVRAAPAPVAAPRQPVSPAPPKLTLDAYLKSRKEGAR